MLVHTAQVRGRKIAWDKREVVQHGLNADRIKFDLDAEFRCCDSYQVVLCGPSLESPKRYIPDKDMTVAVPPSLMESTGPVSTCLLGYVGGEVRVVTAQERYPLVVVESGFTGPLDPGEEQPDLWAQLMSAEAARIEAELARESAEKARADAEAKRIAAEKARETASAEAVKAANEAAAKAEQAARQAEDRVTAALAEVAEAEQARTEAEKARAAAESSRAEAEAARIAAESKRESAEVKRKADSAKAVADASAATSAANAAAGKADAAAQAATDGEASRVAAETARAKAEQARAIAETGRVEAEATRVAHESKRTESFNTNLVSWNSKVDAACKKATDTASKAAQDAKTATDAAIAKTEEVTQAAVAKAQTATDNATTAANKAEAAVSKLPLPLGNTLKGEAESTLVNVHDAYPAPLVTTKVMGQSNQITTTGKNLFNWDSYINDYQFDTSDSGKGFWYAKIPVATGKTTVAVSADKIVKSGEYLAFADAKFGSNTKSIWLAHKSAAEPTRMGTLPTDAEGNLWVWFNNSNAAIRNLYDTGVKVQVEIGTKATAWEPYTGGKPSPSPEYPQEIANLNKAEIVTVGKNLFSAQIDIRSGNTNEPIYLSKGTYTISVKNEVEWWKKTANDNNIYIHTFKENEFLTGVAFRNLVVGQRSYGTFNVNKNCEARFFTYGSWDNNAVTEIQLEAASKATTYEPHKSKSTPIDLKGNELCSLPNGVKDEVVIDAEGNVSLIKRVGSCAIDKSWDWNKGETQNGSSRFVAYVYNQGANHCTNTDVKCRSKIGICSPTDTWLEKDGCAVQGFDESTNCVFMYIKSLANETVDTFKQWITDNPFSVMYLLAEPQTIPLGKVELPALPEATSNIWNNGNIQTDVGVTYVRDANIVIGRLEDKLARVAYGNL